MARRYHNILLSGKLRQTVRWSTYREGGGCLLQDYQCTKTRQPVAEVLREKHLDMCVPPMEKSTCAAFEEYEVVTKTVPLDFTDDDVTWVASKFSSAAGTLRSEAIELRNWLLNCGCLLKELRIVVARMADLMANSPPPPLGRVSRTNGMLPVGAS